jgi:hypothetical protein
LRIDVRMDGWFTCSGAADDDAGFGERGCSGSGRVDKLGLALGFSGLELHPTRPHCSLNSELSLLC